MGFPSPTPSFAWLWDNRELSDCTVQLISVDRPSRKRKADVLVDSLEGFFEGAEDVAAPTAPFKEYHLHLTVLGSVSDYFRTQITNWSASTSTSTSMTCIKIPVEQAELDIVDKVIKFIYTGQLDLDSDLELPKVLAMADRLQVPACILACQERWASIKEGDLDIEMLNTVMSLPPFLTEHPTLEALQKTCKQRLMQLFGDAVHLVYSKALLRLFQQLSFSCVLAWLQSDDLRTDSENTVLLLLDLYVRTASQTVPLPETQLKQLCEATRVCFLTNAFLTDLLPRLDWFQLSREQLVELLRWSVADSTSKVVDDQGLCVYKMPVSWYKQARPACTGSTRARYGHSITICKAAFQQALAKARAANSPSQALFKKLCCTSHGFRFYLYIVLDKETNTCKVGCCSMEPPFLARLQNTAYATVRLSLQQPAPALASTRPLQLGIKGHHCAFLPNCFPSLTGDVTDIRNLEEIFSEGHIRFMLQVVSVDNHAP